MLTGINLHQNLFVSFRLFVIDTPTPSQTNTYIYGSRDQPEHWTRDGRLLPTYPGDPHFSICIQVSLINLFLFGLITVPYIEIYVSLSEKRIYMFLSVLWAWIHNLKVLRQVEGYSF